MRLSLKKINRNRRLKKEWFTPMERFFNRDFINLWNPGTVETVPPANVRMDRNHYLVELAAPGLDQENFQLNLQDNILSVSYFSKRHTEVPFHDIFVRLEYNFSSFSRSLVLPGDVEDKILDAQYINGVLQVRVPRKVEKPVVHRTATVKVH